VGIQDDTDAFV